MKKISILILSFFTAFAAKAQNDNFLERTFAIIGGTAHIGNGEVIENAFILVKNGVIEEVRSEVSPKVPKLYRTIDATGKHIYPGLIAAGTNLGLVEVEAVRATRDFSEVGEFNAHVRSLIAYNTDSKVIPTLTFNGVLTAQVIPSGAIISGSSSIFKLHGWNWEDAVLKADDGLWMAWPREYFQTGWWAEPGVLKKNEKYDTEVSEIKAFFSEAAKYSGGDENLRLAAMKPVFEGKRKLFIEASSSREIISAVEFALSYGISPVIYGGTQAWMIADYLAEKKVPVIVEGVHGLPEHPENDYDQPFKNISLLNAAGVKCALATGGFWQQRNISFMAGTAAAYGLDKGKALQLLTGDMADILGISDQVGTLQAGKNATLIICEGDILEMKSSNLDAAFIQGTAVDLNGMQQQLYQKFRNKYIQQGLIKP